MTIVLWAMRTECGLRSTWLRREVVFRDLALPLRKQPGRRGLRIKPPEWIYYFRDKAHSTRRGLRLCPPGAESSPAMV
jgi:hypothetical protein